MKTTDLEILRALQKGRDRHAPLTADQVEVAGISDIEVQARLGAMVKAGKVITVKHGGKTLYHSLVKVEMPVPVKLPPRKKRDTRPIIGIENRKCIMAFLANATKPQSARDIADGLDVKRVLVSNCLTILGRRGKAVSSMSPPLAGGTRLLWVVAGSDIKFDDTKTARGRIIECLKAMECSAGEIAEATKTSNSTVSTHLRELKADGKAFIVDHGCPNIWSSKPLRNHPANRNQGRA